MQPLLCLSPDVDECEWDTHLCQEGQRCVNLLGSYRCLPDCGPGFRVAAGGASCEGDRREWPGHPREPGTADSASRAVWVAGWMLGSGEIGRGPWQEEGAQGPRRPPLAEVCGDGRRCGSAVSWVGAEA